MEFKLYQFYNVKEYLVMQKIDDDYIKAIALIARVYKDNLDKSGNPEVGHFIRVSDSFYAPNENVIKCPFDELISTGKIVGLLHDVVEDGYLTIDDLASFNFDKEVIEAVSILTRDKKEFPIYHDYISNIINSGNELAIWCKYYDMCDNYTPRRLNLLDKKLKQRLEGKYRYELPRLEFVICRMLDKQLVRKREQV